MADTRTYHLLQETDSEGITFTKNHVKGSRLSLSLHIIALVLLYTTVVFAGALTIVILEQSPKFTKKNSHPRIYSKFAQICRYPRILLFKVDKNDSSSRTHHRIHSRPTIKLPPHS